MKKIGVIVLAVGLLAWLFWPEGSSNLTTTSDQSASAPQQVTNKKPDAFMQEMKEEDDPTKEVENANNATEYSQTDDSTKPTAFDQPVHRFIELLNKNIQGGPIAHFQDVQNKGEYDSKPVELWQYESDFFSHNDEVTTAIRFLATPSGDKFYVAKILVIGGSAQQIKNAITQRVNDEHYLYGELINDPSNLISFVNQVRISDDQSSSIEKSRAIVSNLLDQAKNAIHDGEEDRHMDVQDHGVTFSCIVGNVGGFKLHKTVIAIKAMQKHKLTLRDLQD